MSSYMTVACCTACVNRWMLRLRNSGEAKYSAPGGGGMYGAWGHIVEVGGVSGN